MTATTASIATNTTTYSTMTCPDRGSEEPRALIDRFTISEIVYQGARHTDNRNPNGAGVRDFGLGRAGGGAVYCGAW